MLVSTFVPIQVIAYPAKLACPRRGTFCESTEYMQHMVIIFVKETIVTNYYLQLVTFPMVNVTIITQHIEVLQSMRHVQLEATRNRNYIIRLRNGA